MLQNVRNVAKSSRPDSTTFDNFDTGYSYSYSTRPSIDSINMHPFDWEVGAGKAKF